MAPIPTPPVQVAATAWPGKALPSSFSRGLSGQVCASAAAVQRCYRPCGLKFEGDFRFSSVSEPLRAVGSAVGAARPLRLSQKSSEAIRKASRNLNEQPKTATFLPKMLQVSQSRPLEAFALPGRWSHQDHSCQDPASTP